MRFLLSLVSKPIYFKPEILVTRQWRGFLFQNFIVHEIYCMNLLSEIVPSRREKGFIMTTIKRERIKNRYFWVAREGRRVVATRKVKGSFLIKPIAEDIFKKNNTFFEDRKRTIITFPSWKFNEINEFKTRTKSLRKKSEITNIRPRGKAYFNRSGEKFKGRTVMYVITMKVEGVGVITRSSDAIGSLGVKNSKDAIRQGRERVFSEISTQLGGTYDEDDGVKLSKNKIISIKEGWRYYSRK